MLAESAPDPRGISGGDIFYEHVHFTFNGNYLLARAVLDQVGEALPQLAALPKPGAIPSRQRCAELLALTPWDECQLAADMEELTSKAPFTNQINHLLRQAAARQRRDDLRALATTPEAKQAAWRIYEAALAKAPDDYHLHRRFGKLARQWGRPDVAVEHLRIAVEKLPWNASLHIDLGTALAVQGRGDEAIAHFQTALKIRPDLAEAHSNLGGELARRGQVDEAIAHYRKALEIEPDLAEAHNNLGVALSGRGRVDEAVAHFQKALKIKPDYVNARRNLELARPGGK